MATLTIEPTLSFKAAPRAQTVRPSFLKRLVDAMIASRQRRAEIEIRRRMPLIGGPLHNNDYALLPLGGVSPAAGQD